jgi:tetratricopeptide (TPR) repeat protein
VFYISLNLLKRIRVVALISITLPLYSCISQETKPSLADVDVKYKKESGNSVFIKPKSELEIRQAYADYLNNAEIEDNSRINALSRLAELEFDYSKKLLQDREKLKNNNSNEVKDALYDAQLDKTIALLNTAINDYPEASANDTLLYQLAKAYDQKGEHHESINTLKKLVINFPKTPFYAEAYFRLAEDAFSLQDYPTAEENYTEVIIASNNSIYYEKSMFKRGWARFKQQYYTDAVDDFLQAVLHHDFDEYEKLNAAEHEQFDEYFRAVGLAFSYLGGSEPLYDYFQAQPDFKYTYHTYAMVSNIYLKQQRYSDAVNTHKQFIKHYPDSSNIPYSHLKIIEIWKDSGFIKKVYNSIEDFYLQYNPSSKYWQKQNENSRVNRVIRRSLQEYVVLMTGYYHNKYQESASNADYNNSEKWYKRYLEHYQSYANKDNIYFLYAELLSQKELHAEALKYYELAAYDNEIIVHKEAAFASIVSSDKLLSKNKGNKEYLDKHISYALNYAQQYPTDADTQELITHAAEVAYQSKNYKTAIELADISLLNKPLQPKPYIKGLKAESYFQLGEHVESESIYGELLSADNLSPEQRAQYEDKLALSIYQQGETAQKNNDIVSAIYHFSRICDVAVNSTIASTGLYDAIALNVQHQQWNDVIKQSTQFQRLYPTNKRQADVSKKLSVAYLSSNQGIKAAQEFEKMANMGNDIAIKTAALWQAAELYEEKDKINDAIRSYEEYADKFSTPYPQYMEAMNKLTELYTIKGYAENSNQWRKKITVADEKALNNVKTERTKYITSFAYLGLAQSEKMRFDSLKLTLPLKTSLHKKKSSMQVSVKLYGKASQYKIFEATTEATYAIALIYKDFSKALLESDRPGRLNAEELDQYEILLEDKAFPFEDKAIEFFEINLARIKDGFYNDWIDKTHKELIALFPVRYDRKPKQDAYIDVLH